MTDYWGVLLGGAIGLAGSFIPQLWQSYRAKKSAGGFVASYIHGIIEITNARNHVANARRLLEAWRGPNPDFPISVYGTPDLASDPLLAEASRQIGLLDAADARDAATFLYILMAIRIDLRMIESGRFMTLAVAERIARLQWDLDQWQRAETIGNRLVNRLLPETKI
jgi:hypothetical protein